ncbi:hypothetical protein NDU88_002197 [Pleurodeles waltl]|uniref:Uncharacterized protein n=1 Tax=Pleurodeles waltl TaxID=8319 RepID=A0AAV7Q5Y0_PLEWA|nr:hypothetical protein NDU88_002197 [Pleurodeles waltl]
MSTSRLDTGQRDNTPETKTVRRKWGRPTQAQASQGKRVMIRATAHMTEPPISDKDRSTHSSAADTEGVSDLELAASEQEDLPYVTTQTAEDIL